MLKWKLSKRDTNFCGFMIPVGAVYGIMPRCTINGRHHLKACVWVEDIELAFKNNHFVVFYMQVGYKYPKRMYVSGAHGWAKSIQTYIRNSTEAWGKATPYITRRDIGCAAPRLRTVGAYIQCGTPMGDNTANALTDNFVTNGCHVGKVFLKEEGYCANVLGMDAPNYKG